MSRWEELSEAVQDVLIVLGILIVLASAAGLLVSFA